MTNWGRLTYLLYRLRASFWFVPGGMAVGAFLLAGVSLWLDQAGVSDALRPFGVPFAIEENAARELLSTLTGAMVTVVSLVFSLTLVTLTVAAGNLGARLLERYMQNRVIQVTMGLFVGAFIYGIVVLSTVGNGLFGVPALSVSLMVLISIVAVGWLMYAFNDLARSLQIDQAVAGIATVLRTRITESAVRARDLRQSESDADWEHEENFPDGAPRRTVQAGFAGYVESIDCDALAALARVHGMAVDMRVAQGDHVSEIDPIATLVGGQLGEAELPARVREAVSVGSVRTEADDPMFLVHLLVEIACRALSPGINDVYTALTCADHLNDALVHALRERLPRLRVHDRDGRLLLRTRSVDIARMADVVLSTLRRNGTANTTFALRLIENLGRLAPAAAGHATAPLFLEHLDRIARDAATHVPEIDRAAIEAAADRSRSGFSQLES